MKKRLIVLSVVMLLSSCAKVQQTFKSEDKVLGAGVTALLGLAAASMAHSCNAEVEKTTTTEESPDGTKVTKQTTKHSLKTNTKGSVGKEDNLKTSKE